MEARLKSLQCHFTWEELDRETKPWVVRDDLEDVGTDEGNCWLPHISNLQGYLHHRLGSDQKALDFLHRATEDFRRRHAAEEGPWLMVNYGNLAWLHHLMGQQAESERHLSLAEDLSRRHPMIQEELHPEVAAEKAWTLMALVSDHLKTVEELFQVAIGREPERVEWKTSRVLALVRAEKHEESMTEETWERLQRARDEDPENLYVAVKFLRQRARRGEDVADEARELSQQVLRNPVSSYSGLKPMIRIYKQFLPIDEAVELTKEALREHPEERYLKRCAALCYYWKITYSGRDPVEPSVMTRAISLHQEVIALYPDTCLVKEVNLAEIHACGDLERAEQLFQELLARPLDQSNKQMLFNHYGRYLWYKRRRYGKSLDYHKKATEMEPLGYYGNHSNKFLQKIIARYRNCPQKIEGFLNNLPRNEPQRFGSQFSEGNIDDVIDLLSFTLRSTDHTHI